MCSIKLSALHPISISYYSTSLVISAILAHNSGSMSHVSPQLTALLHDVVLVEWHVRVAFSITASMYESDTGVFVYLLFVHLCFCLLKFYLPWHKSLAPQTNNKGQDQQKNIYPITHKSCVNSLIKGIKFTTEPISLGAAEKCELLHLSYPLVV